MKELKSAKDRVTVGSQPAGWIPALTRGVVKHGTLTAPEDRGCFCE